MEHQDPTAHIRSLAHCAQLHLKTVKKATAVVYKVMDCTEKCRPRFNWFKNENDEDDDDDNYDDDENGLFVQPPFVSRRISWLVVRNSPLSFSPAPVILFPFPARRDGLHPPPSD